MIRATLDFRGIQAPASLKLTDYAADTRIIRISGAFKPRPH